MQWKWSQEHHTGIANARTVEWSWKRVSMTMLPDTKKLRSGHQKMRNVLKRMKNHISDF